MRRPILWFTILIFIFSYDHFFVLSETEIYQEQNVNPHSNDTIQEIAKKIDSIANTLLTHSSAENRSFVLNYLENILLKAAGNLGQKGKDHIRLILDGIKLKIINGTKDKHVATVETPEENENYDQHELNAVNINKIESLIESEESKFNISENKESILNSNKDKLLDFANEAFNELLTNDSSRRRAGQIFENDDKPSFVNKSNVIDEKFAKLDKNYKTSTELISIITRSAACNEFVNRICEDVKQMNRLKCIYEESYITLDKLCDGKPDCRFQSDENNCNSQVMEKLFYIKQIMASLELTKYRHCINFDVSKSVLSNHAMVLQNVLDKELNFKMKPATLNLFNERNIASKEDLNEEKRKANRIALITSTLALYLDGALCTKKLTLDTRRANFLFDIDLEKEFRKSLGSPKSCKCENEICVNCTYYCKRLCRQKHSLTNWNCESVNGTATVALNLLCDGKLDCFDQSDEDGCVSGMGYAKFEASGMFSNILNMLQLKASKQRPPFQKKFNLLSNSIMKLQEQAIKSVPKLETIKILRDKCYSILRTIYSVTVNQSNIASEQEEAYLFLLSINKNLGTALKRSHTGNSKIMGNGCQCSNGTCSVSFCSRICSRACAVEPKLTRYYCGRSYESVAMEKVCDGLKDCSDGYDEINCNTDEICRRHHLVVLRQNLQSIGDNLKGTVLGELLASWKLKVISNLKVVEKNERPTPKVMKKIIKDILADLVVTYGSVEKYRRSTTDYALGVFLDISQIIVESIKSCRK